MILSWRVETRRICIIIVLMYENDDSIYRANSLGQYRENKRVRPMSPYIGLLLDDN